MTPTQKSAVERLREGASLKRIESFWFNISDAQEILSLLTSLERDKARLDWLSTGTNADGVYSHGTWFFIVITPEKVIYEESLRQAIDAAMKGAQ